MHSKCVVSLTMFCDVKSKECVFKGQILGEILIDLNVFDKKIKKGFKELFEFEKKKIAPMNRIYF